MYGVYCWLVVLSACTCLAIKRSRVRVAPATMRSFHCHGSFGNRYGQRPNTAVRTAGGSLARLERVRHLISGLMANSKYCRNTQMKPRPDYGLDSPRIMSTLFMLGAALCGVAYFVASAWRWISLGLGLYFLLGACGMLFYSKIGKLGMRERLLDRISWRGDESVLDIGCGRGLLTVAAAHRALRGSVLGIDIWNPTALSGNRAEAVIENARIEGVENRIEVKQGDARQLPFADASFDVVVSNYVVHELKTRQDRERMIREVARVLKPGGRVALVDFIFTDDCVKDLTRFGIDAVRVRDGFLSFWISAILNLGAIKTYFVLGKKR